MNKNEFMESLREKLAGLDAEDREDAINYYWEYFEEAGFGEESDVTKNVGNPEDVAAKIIEAAEYVKSETDTKGAEKAENTTYEQKNDNVLPDTNDNKVYSNEEKLLGNTALSVLNTDNQDAFDSIDIDLSSLDVIIRTGDEFGVYLNCKENEPIIERVNNCLIIKDRRKGSFVKFNFNFNMFNKGKEFVEITIPRNKELTEINSITEMGKLSLFAITADLLNLEADMGALELVGVSAANSRIEADMGHISVKNGKFERLDISNDTGAVNIAGLEAGYARVSTDTGYISLENAKIGNSELFSDTGYIKVTNGEIAKLSADTDTGLIKLNRVDAGYIDANSDTGSINVKLMGNKEDYSLDLSNDLGVIIVDGKNGGNSIFNNSYREISGDRRVRLSVDTGKINVDFLGR